ncbi:MAG: GDSL-type esterase/lipase family protein [Nitrospirales bacterium]|nr:thrombospondin type 3 repeat-containing protein [Nitrospira sp.]MDR4500848.1 GDSL-type esterase/lipase family protein [Nitrospirales bacterium]
MFSSNSKSSQNASGLKHSRQYLWCTVAIGLFITFGQLHTVDAASLVNGGVISDSISAPGEQDIHTFTATAGESVQLRAAHTGGTVALSPRLTLLAPNGAQIISTSGPQSRDVAAISCFTSSLFCELTQTGTYTVVVSDGTSGGNQTGPYNLHFVRAPGANEGGALPNGGSVSDTIDLGDLDSYTFTANAGEAVQIRMAHTGGTVALIPQINLYAPDGTLIISTSSPQSRDVAAISCFTSSLFCELTQTGTYTVVVTDSNGGQIGPYTLHYARAPGANEGGALPNGGSVSDTIDLGDLDSYTFTANAGEAVQIQVTDLSGGPLSLRVDLYSPSGLLISSTSGDTATINCSDTATFCELTENGTYTVMISDGNSSGAQIGDYSIEFDLILDLLSYAALGDSYSSGEGLPPYFNTTDGFLTGCHRSTRAYSTHIRTPDNTEPIADRADAQFDFLACTGSDTSNITAFGNQQRGDEPPQMAPENGINASRDLLTITIGGNDAFFIRIVIFCFAHDACNEIKPFAPHSNFEIGDLFPLWMAVVKSRLQNLFGEIRTATPNAATLVLDYPLVVSGNECPAVQVPFFPDVKLSASEQAWMRGANQQLNTAVAEAAAQVGLHYVPVANHFQGHEACGDLDDWVNGFVLINPESSFHPTSRGQLEYANVANAYLDSLQTGWPAGYLPNGLPRNPDPVANLQSPATAEVTGPLPAFGDLEVRLASAPAGCTEAVGLVVPGEMARVLGSGFAPSESVTLSLVVANERLPLSTVNADANGNLDATVLIPATLPVGNVGTLEALAAGPDGVGLLLFDLVRIADSITVDSDADGIPDGCDNCPATANTDQADQDLDGRGDICDTCPQDVAGDEDGDSICAESDNCTIIANPDQRDTNNDGYGNVCDADLDNNGIVNTFDLARFKAAFGTSDADADFDGNGVVNTFDLARFKSMFGQPPGPSAADAQ